MAGGTQVVRVHEAMVPVHKRFSWGTVVNLALFITLLWLVYDPFLHPILFRGKSRTELRALANRIALGDTREDVESAFAKLKPVHLRKVVLDDGTLQFETPLEFGAGNWTLIVFFQDTRVAGIGYRTANSNMIHLAEAPADRLLPGLRRTWAKKFLMER